MNVEQFWSLIDAGRAEAGHDIGVHLESLEAALSRCTPEELVEFQGILDNYLAKTYTWELWAAGYIVNGGCSDDGFAYFRAWLISQGENAVDRALDDPESIAALVPNDGGWDAEFEELLSVARQIYEEKTGMEMPFVGAAYPSEPSGEPWDEDDLPTRYPRLTAVAESRWDG